MQETLRLSIKEAMSRLVDAIATTNFEAATDLENPKEVVATLAKVVANPTKVATNLGQAATTLGQATTNYYNYPATIAIDYYHYNYEVGS